MGKEEREKKVREGGERREKGEKMVSDSHHGG